MIKRKRFPEQEGLAPFLRSDVRLHEGLPVAADSPELEGEVILHPRGFGFITTLEGESFFMPESQATGLLTGDRLRFFVKAGASESDQTPEVVQIVHTCRSAHRLLCTLKEAGQGWDLVPDEPVGMALRVATWPLPAQCPPPAGEALWVWREGEVVAVDIPAYQGPPSAAALEVQIVRRLGMRTREGFEQDYARVRYGFDEPLSAELTAEAERVATSPGTEDPAVMGEVEWLAYNAYPFVTIDAETTRDLDDALWAQARPDGGWSLKVAISDVSWYVRPGTMLDEWASRRATSLYLPGDTVPMLPEALSAERCSLVPGEIRRAVVLAIELDAAAQVEAVSVGRALIQSAAKLSYTQVASFMNGDARRVPEPLRESLTALMTLYRALDAARRASGRLEFEDPEPNVVRDSSGNWRLRFVARTPAHKLVEELMLVANREVARILVRRYGAGLFRHQPAPNKHAWGEVVDWAARAAECALPQTPSLPALASLLHAKEDPDYKGAASVRVKSAMRPANYVVCDEAMRAGHFSLDFDWYTHFSSPIRRYADLLVHRLLLAPEGMQLDLEALTEQGRRCSGQARRAKLAERSVWDGIKVEAFTRQVPAGRPVMARVLRSTPRGVRVICQGWGIQAWIPSGSLRRAGWRWAEQRWQDGKEALLEPGCAVTMGWIELDRSRPAYPELIGELVITEERGGVGSE